MHHLHDIRRRLCRHQIRFKTQCKEVRSWLGWYVHSQEANQYGDEAKLILLRTDWFIIPSFVCNIGACIIGIRARTSLTDLRPRSANDLVVIAHYESLTNTPANLPIFAPSQYDTQLVPTLKLIYGLPLVLIPGFTFARLSILTLYLRIFTGRRTRLCTWAVMVLAVVMGFSFQIAAILLCKPVKFFWDRQIPGGCVDLNLYYRAFGLPNILIDISILLVPIPAVWRLHASVGRKMGLSFMFLTGVIALIASCVRWVSLVILRFLSYQWALVDDVRLNS